MVTCIQCGRNIINACSCLNGREKLQEFTRLALRESDLIDKVQFEKRPLFIEIEELKLRKQAQVQIVSTFEVKASASFSRVELGSLGAFTIKLLDWDGNLIYWRKDLGIPQGYDAMTYDWQLRAAAGSTNNK